MSLEHILLNLKVLARVAPHERLRRCTDGILAIDTEIPIYSSLRRLILGEGRDRTIKEITGVVEVVEEKTRDLLNSRFLLSEGDHLDITTQVKHKLLQLVADIEGACRGIQNLHDTTYSRDAITTSQLQLLVSRLQNTRFRIMKVYAD